MQKTYNDLVFAIAKRAKDLADMKMHHLRIENGFNCNTFHEAYEKDRYKSRGQIIEEILTEEFLEEFDTEISHHEVENNFTSEGL
jgi:hypothetical protein